MTDPQLISAFVERWHPETSSLHMSFGEMMITFDNVVVCCIWGDFYTLLSLTEDEVAVLAAELLGVSVQFASFPETFFLVKINNIHAFKLIEYVNAIQIQSC
jgi:hypothetical protein